MADIKTYKPSSSSLSTGQVLHCPYSFEKARLIVQEMTEQLALDLLEKKLVTDQVALSIGYENLSGQQLPSGYAVSVSIDPYGRKVPKHASSSIRLSRPTSSARLLCAASAELFDRITDPVLLVRRITLVASNTVNEANAFIRPAWEQLDLFTDYEQECKRREQEEAQLRRERRCQQAVLEIRRRFGKNAILRGMNLLEGATAMDRNHQIGGHKA